MMCELKIYIPCCDDSLPVVKINSYLFNKYWPEAEVHYLGFTPPTFNFYNPNHYFHSIAPIQEGGATKWTRYLYDFLKGIDEEHIIFSLDDFWLCQEPNYDMVQTAISLAKSNNKIGRFDLTFDTQVEGGFLNVGSIKSGNVIVKHPKTPYRVSTQPSVWNLKFLLEMLDNDWNPWQFELYGSSVVSEKYINSNLTFSFTDDHMVRYPVRTISKGAVSRHNPGKYNVLGLPVDTIKEMVRENFFSEDELIWGQWEGEVPGFYDKGGYGFHPGFLDYHPASKTHFREYNCIYDDDDYPMLTVNVWDNCFTHTINHPDYGYISTQPEKCVRGKKIKFIPRLQKYHDDCGVTLFTEHYLDKDFIKSVDSKVKIGWILEPPIVHPWAYDKIESYIDELDYLFTFSEEVANKYDKARAFPWCAIRLSHKDWGMHEKTKFCSLIASDKKWAPGHKLRHEISDKLAEKHDIELWGKGYKEFPQHGKIYALRDYMFSIIVQNSKLDTFFTDFVDPLATGTIPIFWGSRNVDRYFNTDGIIFFDTLEELENILSNLTEKDYYDRLEAVKDNYERSKNFWRSDDQLAEKIHQVLAEDNSFEKC